MTLARLRHVKLCLLVHPIMERLRKHDKSISQSVLIKSILLFPGDKGVKHEQASLTILSPFRLLISYIRPM